MPWFICFDFIFAKTNKNEKKNAGTCAPAQPHRLGFFCQPLKLIWTSMQKRQYGWKSISWMSQMKRSMWKTLKPDKKSTFLHVIRRWRRVIILMGKLAIKMCLIKWFVHFCDSGKHMYKPMDGWTYVFHHRFRLIVMIITIQYYDSLLLKLLNLHSQHSHSPRKKKDLFYFFTILTRWKSRLALDGQSWIFHSFDDDDEIGRPLFLS